MSNQPVALYYHERAGLTFRWERGAGRMLVFRGNEMTEQRGALVDQVPVRVDGWLDHAEVRQRAEAWLRERNGRIG